MAVARPKDKCPSCFQPIAPTDFLCPNCELILDPSQAPEGRNTEVSVVRRMLERPQRSIPSAKLDVKAEVRAATRSKSEGFQPGGASRDGLEGPTRKLDLGPELAGVPVVVATLSRKSESLTELEAWLVSLIDGLCNAEALAKKAGVRELELRVMLRTLNEKRIIDFADEPLSDEDLDLPAVMGTMAADVDGDEPADLSMVPPAPAPAVAVPAPSYGANVDRRDGRFVAPPSNQSRTSSADDWSNVMPKDESPPPPARVSTGTPSQGAARAAPRAPTRATGGVPAFPGSVPPPSVSRGIPPELFDEEQEAPIVTGKAVPPVLTPSSQPARAVSRHEQSSPAKMPAYPSKPVNVEAESRGKQPPGPSAAAPPQGVQATVEGRTDPRIVYNGKANRKVLDALKQVKRNDGSGPATREEEKQPLADVLARDSLQVALRMEQNGRMDEAIRFLERSIGQSPDAASLYNRLGIILMRERGDYRRAEQMIRKATELVPDNKVYATNLQQVLSRHAMKSHR